MLCVIPTNVSLRCVPTLPGDTRMKKEKIVPSHHAITFITSHVSDGFKHGYVRLLYVRLAATDGVIGSLLTDTQLDFVFF